jgi:sulfate-transporting ATPase
MSAMRRSAAPSTTTSARAQYVYTMHRVGKTVPPKRQILKDISLSFLPRREDRHPGPQRSGKSTMLRIMAGVDTEIDGEAKPDAGTHDRLPRTRAEARSGEDRPRDGRRSARRVLAARKRLDEVYAAYGDPDADFDKLAAEQAKLEAIVFAQDGDDLDQQLEIAADALRLPPWDAKIGPLSGGEKRRVALCRLLLSKPDMLLLDEPTNHLDAESVEWLEHFLQRFPGTVVAVTHDRYFLDNAAEWILELDRGRGIPWKGNYSSWLDQKQQRLAQEEAAESARQKALKKELEWVRAGTKGRSRRARAAWRASRNSRATNTSGATKRKRSSFRSPSGSAIR